jgi:hypothetical protein
MLMRSEQGEKCFGDAKLGGTDQEQRLSESLGKLIQSIELAKKTSRSDMANCSNSDGSVLN